MVHKIAIEIEVEASAEDEAKELLEELLETDPCIVGWEFLTENV